MGEIPKKFFKIFFKKVLTNSNLGLIISIERKKER